MSEFNIHINQKESSKKKQLFCVGELYSKDPSEENSRKLKRELYNFSYAFLDSGMDKRQFNKQLKNTLGELDYSSINIYGALKTNNIQNISQSIHINYNIEKYRSSNSKHEKDIYFSYLYDQVDSFVASIVKKENMGNFDEDLMSAGFMGVLKALEGDFDPLQANFLTYCYHDIRRSIQKEKGNIHPGFYVPPIHDHFYNVYQKEFKEKLGNDETDLKEDIVVSTVKRLKDSNFNITEEHLKNIVTYRLGGPLSLDHDNGNSNEDSSVSLLDSIEAESNIDQKKKEIDSELFKNKLEDWLKRYTDFEKVILERRFGIDFGSETRFPIYTVKVSKNGEVGEKQMVAVKCKDAMDRVESLGYKILSTKEQIEETKEMQIIKGATREKLKEYFEVVKLTSLSEVALKKNEDSLIKQLTEHFKKVYKDKNMEFPEIVSV